MKIHRSNPSEMKTRAAASRESLFLYAFLAFASSSAVKGLLSNSPENGFILQLGQIFLFTIHILIHS